MTTKYDYNEAMETVHLEILREPYDLEEVMAKGLKESSLSNEKAIGILTALHAIALKRRHVLVGLDSEIAAEIEKAFDLVYAIVEQEAHYRVTA